MSLVTLDFARRIALPPAIVWDAFIDPVLLEGWLGEAEVDPVVGGRFTVSSLSGGAAISGTVGALVERERLLVEEGEGGGIDVRLTAVPGGPRDVSTRLDLDVRTDDGLAAAPRLQAEWLAALDQLDELLHGRPVDWGARGSAGRDAQRMGPGARP